MKKALRYTLYVLLALITGVGVYIYTLEKKRLRLTVNTDTTIYNPDTTQFVIPLSLSLKDIEQLANSRLQTVLFDGTLPAKRNGDTVYLKLWRTENVKFSFSGNKLVAAVSLQAKLGYKLKITERKSKTFFKDNPFMVEMDVLLETPVILTSQYGFSPKTKIKSISWKKQPVINVLMFAVDLKDKLERVIFSHEEQITSKLDEVIRSKISLKKTMQSVWANMQKPVRLSKNDIQLYLNTQPISMSAWLAPCRGDSLNLILQIQTLMHIVEARDTILYKVAPLPGQIVLLKRPPADDTSRFNVHIMLPISTLEELSNKKLKGKEIKYEDFGITIDKIKISNGKESVFLHINYSGHTSGELVVKGHPVLDIQTRRLNISGLEFESRNDDVLIDATDKVFHEMILDEVKGSTIIDVGNLMDTLPVLIRTGIDKSKLASKAAIHFSNFELSNVETHLTAGSIQLMVSGSTHLSVQLKKEAIVRTKKRKAIK